jgi:FMN phosphatase YigB (HAD superfamily)
MNHSSPYPVKAVLFDWDLTLGATLGDVSWGERLAALFEQAGLRYESEAILAAIGQRRQAIQEGRLPGLLKPQEKDDILLYYQQLLHLLGHAETSAPLLEQIYTGYAFLPFVFYPDALPALQAVAAQKLQLGIITNHVPQIRPVIEDRLKGLVLPEHIIISSELGVYKPEPAIFQEAAIRLGLPADRCMYIGDNLEVDAIGAVAAGGYACGLWCDRLGQAQIENFPEHVYRITQLNQIFTYIDS